MSKTLAACCLIVLACAMGCSGSSDYESSEQAMRDYQEMKAWDRYLQNETNRINQTYDNLNRHSRNMGFETID